MPSLFDGIHCDDEVEEEVMRESSGRTSIDDASMKSAMNNSSIASSGLANHINVSNSSTPHSLLDEVCGDEADTRMFVGTLRSGQRFESEHSLVIMGDVNSGAEVVAGGDIIVLGKLRGIAHAGAFDETGGGRIIFSTDLSPTQLRIGAVITRGSSDGQEVKPVSFRGEPRDGAPLRAEIAKVEGNLIVVQAYNSRERLR